MLTRSQERAYQFIQCFVKQHGHSPTMAEIASGIGIKSRGVVHRYIKALVKAGLIKILPSRHRNIQVTAKEADNQLILIGAISQNKPLDLLTGHAVTNLAKDLLGEDRFALRVVGNSMIEEGIFDRDILICEKKEKTKTGHVVVALIDDEKAILKKIQYNSDHTITLLPVHSRILPQVYPGERIKIYGEFIGLIRLHE